MHITLNVPERVYTTKLGSGLLRWHPESGLSLR
jgi:hypothetical protein